MRKCSDTECASAEGSAESRNLASRLVHVKRSRSGRYVQRGRWLAGPARPTTTAAGLAAETVGDYRALSTMAVILPLGTAPTCVSCTCPPLNRIIVGTPRME